MLSVRVTSQGLAGLARPSTESQTTGSEGQRKGHWLTGSGWQEMIRKDIFKAENKKIRETLSHSQWISLTHWG